MKTLPLLLTLILMTVLCACSTSPQGMVKKKALISDHHLMLSLLNRPISQDQQMMLAFARQRAQLQSPYFVHAISIKGPKQQATATKSVAHHYSALIAQDFNSVQISGPK
ncbi:hypothetical protein SAMN05216262_10356 [Colwellia chukchiensis]|uniref:Lipoprotein n=1 Tax=Colwellia chukchiensis TaxID=641665 RepID=A0A1H7K800_9GAMM|nr:hypothetical protein [Colwellia chukchiensis]SEK83013.1 hypothetical protein SAMN05216262_10356 [Colwellia chukchiensis]